VLIEIEPNARARSLRAVQIGHFAHELIQAEARDVHLRRAGVLTERVHHLLHRLDLLHDGTRAALEDLRIALAHAGEQPAPQPLG